MKPIFPTSVEEKGLSNWVMTSLRDAILNGHFEPGEKLDQDQIAASLNVSRTPIREALKVLESEGFVEIQPYRGAFIPKIAKRDIQDVFEVRWVIEPEIVRQAVPLLPPEVLSHFRKILKESNFSIHPGGEQRFYQIDQEFHNTLATYCQNRLFKEILDKMNNRIVRVRRFALRQPGTHLDNSQEEHVQIYEAICRQDLEEATARMKQHLMNSANRIMHYLDE
jgi:DNA-binding GntR family transcriptional regulator